MVRHFTTFAFLAALAGPVVAGGDFVKWGESGTWEILVDPATGNGCLMQKRFKDGTLVQYGTLPERDGGFFALYNSDWTDIPDGATGKVTFEFPEIRFVGEALGIARDGRFGGYAFFDNPNVTREFARNNDMTITGELGRVVEVNLKDTMKGVRAVKACQEEQSR